MDYYQSLLDKDDIKVAFFGDDILQDVAANYEFDQNLLLSGSKARWDTITTLSASTDAPAPKKDDPVDEPDSKKKKSSKKDNPGDSGKAGKPGKIRKNKEDKKESDEKDSKDDKDDNN